MKKPTNTIEQKVDDILDIVIFLKDNCVSKEEFNEFKEETKKQFDTINFKLDSLKEEVNDVKNVLN